MILHGGSDSEERPLVDDSPFFTTINMQTQQCCELAQESGGSRGPGTPSLKVLSKHKIYAFELRTTIFS